MPCWCPAALGGVWGGGRAELLSVGLGVTGPSGCRWEVMLVGVEARVGWQVGGFAFYFFVPLLQEKNLGCSNHLPFPLC